MTDVPAGALVDWLRTAPGKYADRTALIEPGSGSISHRALGELSRSVALALTARGVVPGARVGVCVPKSVAAVAAIFGTLRTGAAYVPVDPSGPPARSAWALGDCSVHAVVVARDLAGPLRASWPDGRPPTFLEIDPGGCGAGLADALGRGDGAGGSFADRAAPDDLAYILYTSGSTGRPKGVALTHRNAVSFLDWCSEAFAPSAEDRFSSHAPFHFDLSILDLYLPMRHGGALVLIPEGVARNPAGLSSLIEQERISVWYSTPTVLELILRHGNLGQRDLSDLRLVLFAGEVFPVKHLRALMDAVPWAVHWNLYGPTETNVCTAYRVPGPVPEGRSAPYPIGKACTHASVYVARADGTPAGPGEEGELLVAGPGVMRGYWGRPEETMAAFIERDGRRWYRTGDMVVEDADGELRFIGRRDRMVKRRGYRVELDEIEHALRAHHQVAAVAVVAAPGADSSQRVTAHVVPVAGIDRISTITLKTYCASRIPTYMIPDDFRFRTDLPHTPTDKVDYQALAREA